MYIPSEIDAPSLPASLDVISRHVGQWDSKPELVSKSPIFILSAGWRSGSTLLQRLVCSDPQTMVWGEPFGDRIPICRLAATVDHFKDDDGHLRYEFDRFDSQLESQWIANMNPGVKCLREAHLAFFETLFAKPAAEHGKARWGIKAVRLSAEYGHYLRWLYPNARILLLVRNPVDAYRSYRGSRWYTIKPTHQILSLKQFLSHWQFTAQSFLRNESSLGALLIRYEDLAPAGDAFLKICDYTGLDLKASVLAHSVGSSKKRTKPVSFLGRLLASRLVGKTCAQLGYNISWRGKNSK